MPRGRKPATRSARASGDQSTLSFGNRSRVTKPSALPTAGKKTKDDPATSDTLVTDVFTPEDSQTGTATPEAETEVEEEPTTSEIAIREQARQEMKEVEKEVEKEKSRVEVEALGVSEASLKKYWRDREKERKAPRVHQEDLSMNEKILRHFDLSSQYGPCIGIARMKRWNRANGLDLHPPIEVLAVLLREEEKENVKAERAYVDELMSSRFVADH